MKDGVNVVLGEVMKHFGCRVSCKGRKKGHKLISPILLAISMLVVEDFKLNGGGFLQSDGRVPPHTGNFLVGFR